MPYDDSTNQTGSLLVDAHELIHLSELLVMGERKPKSRVGKFFHFFLPVAFLQAGADPLWGRIGRLIVYLIVGEVIARGFSYLFNMADQQRIGLQLAVVALAMLLIIFRPPSSYAITHVRDKDVDELECFLEERNISSVAHLALLDDSMENAERRVAKMVESVRWAVGIEWAVFIWWSTQHFNALPKPLPAGSSDLVITVGAYVLFSAGLLWFSTSAYQRAADQTFRTIFFAIAERRRDCELAKSAID